MRMRCSTTSLPFTSSAPIPKEQRKNEKSSKNLAFSLRLGHGRRRSNSSRRCRLHSRALSPLPFAVAATTAAGAAAHRRLHFRRPSPVLHPRRSPVTAATASGGAAASTHTSSGGTVSNGQGYACDSFLSVDFPAIWACA